MSCRVHFCCTGMRNEEALEHCAYLKRNHKEAKMMSSRQIGLHGSIDIRSDNNENDVVFTNTTKHGSSIDGGKTPAGGKTRRALGDISNRKTQPNGIQDGKNGFPSKTPVPTKTDKTSKTNKKPIKNSATKSLFKQDTSLKPVNLNNHRKVEFKLPSESQKSSQQSFILQTDSVKPLDTKLDDSFDIIQPAGRTWAQQIANGDHDEEPDDLSLEGASTVYEDYFKIQMLEHEHKLKLLKLEDDEASKFIENIYDDWVKSGFEQDNNATVENFFVGHTIVHDLNLDLDEDFDFLDFNISLPDLQ